MGKDEENAVCPTCGRDDFASTTGMKIHHKGEHNESIAGVTVECARCGESKEVDRYMVEKNDRHFCGRECQGGWRSEHYTGEKAPTWNGGKETVECAWCGESKEVDRHVVEKNDRHFCGRECQGEWCSEHYTGEKSPTWNGGKKTVECAWCGESKQIIPSKLERYNTHFCDPECKGAWMSENIIREKHPLWKGGRSSYGEGWTAKKKERVRDRHDRQCADCGIHEDELSRSLDVHHIQKARSFDDSVKANDPSNLVALCPGCHSKWEQMSPLRPETEAVAGD
jgi:5-methylcytosine-specific restriction endonuclease McrA